MENLSLLNHVSLQGRNWKLKEPGTKVQSVESIHLRRLRIHTMNLHLPWSGIPHYLFKDYTSYYAITIYVKLQYFTSECTA